MPDENSSIIDRALKSQIELQMPDENNSITDRALKYSVTMTCDNSITDKALKYRATMPGDNNSITDRALKYRATMPGDNNSITDRALKYRATMPGDNSITDRALKYRATMPGDNSSITDRALKSHINSFILRLLCISSDGEHLSNSSNQGLVMLIRIVLSIDTFSCHLLYIYFLVVTLNIMYRFPHNRNRIKILENVHALFCCQLESPGIAHSDL